MFAFYVLPSLGIVLSRFTCAVLALGLNEGAYVAEIIRAGLRGVGENQREAARALGLKPWYAMRFVVLPQAFRIIIPPIGNQFISMLKLTALVEVIGVQELLWSPIRLHLPTSVTSRRSRRPGCTISH